LLLLAWAVFPGEEQAEEAAAVLGSSGSSSQVAIPPSVIAWKGEEDNESLSSSQNPGRNKQTDQEGGREEGGANLNLPLHYSHKQIIRQEEEQQQHDGRASKTLPGRRSSSGSNIFQGHRPCVRRWMLGNLRRSHSCCLLNILGA
jgi:hypothetical protein